MAIIHRTVLLQDIQKTKTQQRCTKRDRQQKQHLISKHWEPQTELQEVRGAAASRALQCQLRQSVNGAVDVLEPVLQELKENELCTDCSFPAQQMPRLLRTLLGTDNITGQQITGCS